MTLCALLKDMLPYLIILSIVLADVLLSMALYDQLLLLGMECFNATGVTALFCFFFCILTVALLKLMDTILTAGSRPPPPPSASLSASPYSSPPALDSPPSYCRLMEVEKGELPSYNEATK